ncbi:MAG: ImmA/IrrE family metallo-endopeptidase [Erysipelotrichia bacterium]|nr:ImmA/IrrE family metallo-endopeptidase [Erysipelotrichia bacterium]
MTKSRSYIATPPGVTIKEQLEDRNMNQKEFAIRMDMSEKHISHLINGDVQLTPVVAYRLETVLGLPAKFWNNLEAIYREKLIRVEAENSLDTDKELAKNFPYKEMSDNGWLPETRKIEERVINLRKFFEVVQLTKLKTTALIPSVACRRLSITEKADFALIAWVQKAKLEARHVQTSTIDIKGLENSLETIRSMTFNTQANFSNRLRELLAEHGIALIFLPHIKGSFLHGATFYDKNKIVIGITFRGKDADKFWFSLLHEIGHIILGHLNQTKSIDEYAEKEADQFAKNILIPQNAFDTFVKQNSFSKESIINFSKKIEIGPGIVVGRLQKENYIDFSQYNELKTKFELTI